MLISRPWSLWCTHFSHNTRFYIRLKHLHFQFSLLEMTTCAKKTGRRDGENMWNKDSGTGLISVVQIRELWSEEHWRGDFKQATAKGKWAAGIWGASANQYHYQSNKELGLRAGPIWNSSLQSLITNSSTLAHFPSCSLKALLSEKPIAENRSWGIRNESGKKVNVRPRNVVRDRESRRVLSRIMLRWKQMFWRIIWKLCAKCLTLTEIHSSIKGLFFL
jgi:hypothetical protein